MANKPWPEGVSDGLTLACAYCHTIPAWDYTVSDAVWESLVPQEHKRGIVCLSCLDRLALQNGMDAVGIHLEGVQFCGQSHTVILKVESVHKFERRRDGK